VSKFTERKKERCKAFGKEIKWRKPSLYTVKTGGPLIPEFVSQHYLSVATLANCQIQVKTWLWLINKTSWPLILYGIGT